MAHQSLTSAESKAAYGARYCTPSLIKDPRKAVRYALRTEVVFSWSDKGGPRRKSRGVTRDISPKGAYVIAVSGPPLGAPLTMSFYLPTLRGESQGVQVQAQSRVLRVDSGAAGRCIGFAVVNERTKLCKS
jgi:hypothetical protein